jgi:O-antigen ligase
MKQSVLAVRRRGLITRHSFALALQQLRQTAVFEQSMFCLFMLGLAWVPFWYGSNDILAWGINAVLFPGLVALYEVALLIGKKAHPVAIRHIAASAILFAIVLIWIWVQTLSWLPSPLVNPVWTMASDALGRALDGSISVNRDLTVLGLVRLITAASVFWLALQLCRDGVRARLFVTVIAAIGCAYAVYGLIAVKTGHLPWLDIWPQNGRVSSTFFNRNHFATYAGLTLIAVVALTQRLYQRALGDVPRGWRIQLATLIDIAGGRGAALLIGAFLIAVALLLTGSRGGIISAGLGLVVLGLWAHGSVGRQGGQSIVATLFAFIIVAAILYAFGGFFAGSFEERGVSDLGRLGVFGLMLRSILDAPLLGFGYGTFFDVFPMYRDRSINVIGTWPHAHNTYLEVFQGLGLPFGSLLIASVALLVLRCVRGSIQRQSHVMVPRVATSAACLIGINALVDFSLQIQGVTLTFAAMLGAGVAQSESSRVALSD